MTFAERVERSDPLFGALVLLPADELVAIVARVGLDFLAIDVVDGPLDEVRLRRLTSAARGARLGVVVLAGDDQPADRLRTLGADLVVGPGGLTVVADEAGARRALSSGFRLVALDVTGVLVAALSRFAAVPDSAGEREPLVLLPGMLGDARVFDDIVAELPAEVSCRPTRIDLDDSIEEIAESVLAVAPPRFALAGHSLGGIVALEVWRRAPQRVARLALLNTSSRPPSDAQLEAWRSLRARTEAGEFAAVVEEQVVVNLGPAAPTELVERWVEMAERVGPAGFVRQLLAQTTRPDSRPTLATVDVPTLVVSGSEDAVCPPALQAELGAGIPGAVHVTVNGGGHMAPLDHPAEVAAHLVTWLAS